MDGFLQNVKNMNMEDDITLFYKKHGFAAADLTSYHGQGKNSLSDCLGFKVSKIKGQIFR